MCPDYSAAVQSAPSFESYDRYPGLDFHNLFDYQWWGGCRALHACDRLIEQIMLQGLAADLVRIALKPCLSTLEAVGIVHPTSMFLQTATHLWCDPRSQGSALQGGYCKLSGDVVTLAQRCINENDCYAFVYRPKGMCPPLAMKVLNTWRTDLCRTFADGLTCMCCHPGAPSLLVVGCPVQMGLFGSREARQQQLRLCASPHC